VTGRHFEDSYTDAAPVQRLAAPVVVISCLEAAAVNEWFILEREHIAKSETVCGRISDGAWVLMRTEWSNREDPAAFLNVLEDGSLYRGPSARAIEFPFEQRNMNGWGVEAAGTDAGQAFTFEPTFLVHALMHAANRSGFTSLCNLDQLPPERGGSRYASLKIKKGSSNPLRIFAL
jgi:kynurenine formamidase